MNRQTIFEAPKGYLVLCIASKEDHNKKNHSLKKLFDKKAHYTLDPALATPTSETSDGGSSSNYEVKKTRRATISFMMNSSTSAPSLNIVRDEPTLLLEEEEDKEFLEQIPITKAVDKKKKRRFSFHLPGGK